MSLKLILSGALIAGCAWRTASAQQSLPRAPGAHVVTVSKLGAEEPGIAVNPRNPAQVVVVFQPPGQVAYSTDSGRTFTPAELGPAADWRGAPGGDVSTTFDI